MIEGVEVDNNCNHQFKSVAQDGYEAGIRWCQVCGTVEGYTIDLDPYVEHLKFRKVPK